MIGLLDIAVQLSRALATVPAALDDEDERRGRRLRGGGGGVRSRGDGPRSSGAAAGSVRAFSVRGRVASESAAPGRQAAVIKIASFAAGSRRVGALTDYLSRDGELAVETETGFRLTGSEAIRAETADWADLFANRAPSKDVATLKVAGLQGEADEATAAFRTALGPRRFAWQRDPEGSGTITVVAVLAAPDRRRLDVSAAGCRTIAASLQAQQPEKDSAVHVELGSTGHGKDGLGYRLARLVARGPVHLHDGGTVTTPAEASAVTRAWAPSLNSRRIRDTMHLVMSAKAGTDVESFRATARAFLGETFEGHRYLFALHQDRDHVHAHAVITMRAESGQKLDPKIQDFARWRESFAEHARAHGIDIVATRRLARASAPAFKLRDVHLVEDAALRGETSPTRALARIEAKRNDAIHVPTRNEGLEAVQKALAALADTDRPDRQRLAVADIAGQFIASLKGLQGAIHPSRKETAMRSVDELQSDLKAMNAAATRIALLLPPPSRGQFHALANPILESAAAVLDQAVAGSAVTRLAAEAGDLARQERREARDAREVADLAQRAAEPLRRNEGPGSGERLEAEALARSAERTAAREQHEALAAADLARRVAASETVPESVPARTDAARELRQKQEQALRQQQAGNRSTERERGAEDEA
ncbi:MAG: relaxase/mobilization nuclease domain-containing protein [Aestuariivirga sp.]